MTEKNDSQLRSMVIKGKTYRETIEVELLGETAEVEIRPLKDTEFTELVERMDDTIDEEEFEDKVDDMSEEDEVPDETEFDKEFVEIMRDAAKLGIDHEAIGETQESVNELVDDMVGGISMEIGGEVMEITSDLQEAENFR